MRNNLFLGSCFIVLPLLFISCLNERIVPAANYEIPLTKHDVSYIPYNIKPDNPNYIICDSTNIRSGRNRLQYIGGSNQLKQDIIASYSFKPAYQSFNGYIVVRFLVNCKDQSGRYRAQSLHLDFSPVTAPSDLLASTLALVQSLDNWTKSPTKDSKSEYSKFINIKFSHGQIQHVLL